MALPHRSAPFWFHLCVTVAVAAAMRWCVPGAGVQDGAPGHAPDVHLAFFGFFLLLGELIWKGISVAGRVTLEILKWVVANLSLVVAKLSNGFKALGAGLLQGLKRAWDFTRKLYDDVLKPAWSKFWRIFDKFRRWLDDTFGPVLEWLRVLRDNVLQFYRNYVRPWLDLIDVTRKVLRVLAALHIPFARKLDRWLGELERRIEQPFRFLIGEINKVITIVNRVVTLDGLLQRLVLIRTLERDMRYAARGLFNWRVKPLDAQDWTDVRKAMNKRTEAQVTGEFSDLVARGQGPLSGLASEMAVTWRQRFSGGR